MEEAITRFHGALDGLQTAIDGRRVNEDKLGQIEADLHLMALDRAQLARRLDEALAKLNEANGQAQVEHLSTRLDAAISEIDELIAFAEAA